MNDEELNQYRNKKEYEMYEEYQEIMYQFKFVVETDRRFYLANEVEMKAKNETNDVYFEVDLKDCWVWDPFRPQRFVKTVHVFSFRDINIEEITSD